MKKKGIITESPESLPPKSDPIILDSETMDDFLEDRLDFPDFPEDRDRLDLVDFPDSDLADPPDTTLRLALLPLLNIHNISIFRNTATIIQGHTVNVTPVVTNRFTAT